MFELPVAYVNQAERERVVATDLRRRQILKTLEGGSGSTPAQAAAVTTPRTAGTRVHVVER